MRFSNPLKPILLVASLSIGLLTGCSSLRTVNIQEDAALAGASVNVDVIPETAGNAPIESVPVHQYFRGSALRNSPGITHLRFGVGQPASQSVTKDWQKLGAKKVVVIADLPGVFQDLPGDSDPRRKIIPVGKSATVTVRLSPSGLVVDSQ